MISAAKQLKKKKDCEMSRYITLIGLLAPLLTASVSEVDAQSNASFKAAVGEIGSDSFAFGIELWALSETQLFPEHNIRVKTVEVTSDSDRLNSLLEGSAQFAIVDGVASASNGFELRSIIAHRPKGDDGRRAKKPLQLVTRADAPKDVVYRITSMIFDHATYISGNTARARIETLGHAMKGLSLPVHPGAIRFYEDQADSLSTMFGHNDDEALNSDEALQLREACLAAAARGEAAHFIGYSMDAPCDVTLARRSLSERSSGQGGPMTIADHQGVSKWHTHTPKAASELNVMEFQPTM